MRGKNKSHKIRLILGVLIGLSLVLIIFFSLYNRQNIKVSNKDKKTDVINETNNNQDNETLIEEVKEKDSNELIESNDNSTSKSEQKVEAKNKDKKSMPKIAYNDFLFFISLNSSLSQKKTLQSA